MSNFVTPMMAKALDNSKNARSISPSEYSLEPKHDGMRAIIVKRNTDVAVYSRTGKVYTDHLPSLTKKLRGLPFDFIIDGELAVIAKVVDIYGHEVPVVDFNKTMRIMGSGSDKAVSKQADDIVSFLAFDILSIDGLDYTHLSYVDRQAKLLEWIGTYTDSELSINPSFDTWDDELYSRLVDEGIEGAIFKYRASTYSPGKRPSKTWYKRKVESTADVVVMGFHDAKEGKFEGQIGSILFGAYDEEGVLRYVGRCSGMNDEDRQRWTEIRNEETVDQWNKRVLEIKYNDLVGAKEVKTPRHPQFVIERVDKNPEDCSLDQFKT